MLRGVFRLLLRLAALVLLVAIAFTAVLAWRGHWLRDVQPAYAGSCEALELGGSAEDIQLDRERGFAYLSLLDRKALVGGGNVQGTIVRVDLNAPELRAEAALETQPEHFRPHGLSLYIDAAGRRWLYALNHPLKRGEEPERVELFEELSPGRFRHVATFSDPERFVSPNDLVAVGPRQFYVANDKPAGGLLSAALQQLGIGASPLVYVDNGRAQIVARDIASGGGINVSPDGRRIYVSETAAQRIRVFEREPVTGDLTELERLPLGTSPDNIDVAPDGSLWIGAHANTLRLIQHFAAGKPAPSQVLRLTLRGGSAQQQDIFLDDGRLFSASSVGVSYGPLLLVGSITERKLLVCRGEPD